MTVFRLVNTSYAKDLSGEGARLHGGRWNEAGIPCVYASESRALAVLEFSVHVSLQFILRSMSIVEVYIPNDFHDVPVEDLPDNWRTAPAPASTKAFGTSLLRAALHPVIRLPSSVLPEEKNYIINPRHPIAKQCRIVNIADFAYDIRIKNT